MEIVQLLAWIGAWAGVWYGITRLAKAKAISRWIGHLAGGTIGLFVSLAVLSLFLPKPDQEQAAVTAVPADVPTSVSSGQLFAAYHANEVAADVKYKGKALAVVGRVTAISKDVFDNVTVALHTPNEFMPVRASIDDSEESKAAALQRGQRVVVTCTGAGMLIGSPILDDCRLN